MHVVEGCNFWCYVRGFRNCKTSEEKRCEKSNAECGKPRGATVVLE
jgi:hypothetical protein